MTALETFGPWVFFRSLLRDPLSVGAVVPSSPRLSRLVASSVGEGDSLVVEVGAGTGSITEALLDRGVRPERLLLFERDAFLAAYLQDRFSRGQVSWGGARHANSVLKIG